MTESILLETVFPDPPDDIWGGFSISLSMLRKGRAKIRYSPDGSINSVLALYKADKECGSRWTVSSTAYYNRWIEKFEGYVELEHPKEHDLLVNPRHLDLPKQG